MVSRRGLALQYAMAQLNNYMITQTKLLVSTKSTSRKLSDYAHYSFNNMVENCIDCFGEEFRDRYQLFVDQLTDRKINDKELMVDDDILKNFIADCDETANRDYREGHIVDDDDTVAGGRWMDRLYRKLATAHPQYAVPEPVGMYDCLPK